MAVKKKSATKQKSAAPPRRPSKEVRDLASKMRGIDLCSMTTRSTGKSLRTRPMSNNGEVEFNGDAWFFSWKDSQKVRDLRRSPAVSLSYTGGNKKAPTWIVVYGEGTVVEDASLKKKLWQKELERWFHSGPDNEEIVLIRVSATRATWWSYEGEGEVTF